MTTLSPAEQADGDVSGTYSNLQLKANVVGATELSNGAVSSHETASCKYVPVARF